MAARDGGVAMVSLPRENPVDDSPCSAAFGEVRDVQIVDPLLNVSVFRNHLCRQGRMIATGGLNEIRDVQSAKTLPRGSQYNACGVGTSAGVCSQYICRRTKRLSRTRQPTLIDGLRELAMTKALSERGVMPRIGPIWLELAAPFRSTPSWTRRQGVASANTRRGAFSSASHRLSSGGSPSSKQLQTERYWRQFVHINVILERVTPLTSVDLLHQLERLADLAVTTATTDLSDGRAGAGLVNLDLKPSHAVTAMTGSVHLIDFDVESTFHLKDSAVGPSCRACAGSGVLEPDLACSTMLPLFSCPSEVPARAPILQAHTAGATSCSCAASCTAIAAQHCPSDAADG